MGLTTDYKRCEVCGKKTIYFYDSRELRKENLCLNEECGYYYISFDKKTTFKPTHVSDTYVDVLNNLEGFLSEGEWTNEGFSSSNMKGIWKGEGFGRRCPLGNVGRNWGKPRCPSGGLTQTRGHGK